MSLTTQQPLATCGLCQSLDIEGNHRTCSGGALVGGEELRTSAESCPGCSFIFAGLQAWRLSSAAKHDDEGQQIPLGDLMLSPCLPKPGIQIVQSSKKHVEDDTTNDLARRVEKVKSEERETIGQMSLQVQHARIDPDYGWLLSLGGILATLQFYKISDNVDSFSCLSSSHQLAQATFDDSVVSRIFAMIAHCKKNHEGCWKDSKSFMPTRLIDVACSEKQTTTVFLREHLSEPQPYLTLSYRWTTNQDRALTTHANREQRLCGFPAPELTQLMQDVIAMARKLGIRYVWIDAVCIIQDDKEDWAFEAPLMAQIYHKSVLTLSISTALDEDSITTRRLVDIPFKHPPNAGTPDFFVRIDPSHNVPHRLDKAQGSGIFDETDKHRPAALAQEHPVFSRGWCFQERLLSQRILHHTANEFIWQCQSETWCECGAAPFYPGSNSRLPRYKTIPQQPLSVPGLLPFFFEEWRLLVHDYSWNELTFDADILPAISGLAHDYQDKVCRGATGRYFAGHWEKDLPHSLLWHTLDARDFIYLLSDTPISMINSRRSLEIAPSWSWANIKGPIRWPTEGVFAVLNEYESGRDGVEVEYAEVRARCTPRTADEMGQLAGQAELTVKTRVVQEVHSVFLNSCSVPWRFVQEPPVDDVLYASRLSNGKSVCMSVFLDTVEDRDSWGDNDFWLARLCKVVRAGDTVLGKEGMKWRRRVGTVALMLLRRDDGKFRRVGIATSPRKRIAEVDVSVLAKEIGDEKEMIDGPADNAFDECFDSVEETDICIV